MPSRQRPREFEKSADLGWRVTLAWQDRVNRLAAGRPCFENTLQPSIRDVVASGGIIDLGDAGPFGSQISQADTVAEDKRDGNFNGLGLSVTFCETPLREQILVTPRRNNGAVLAKVAGMGWCSETSKVGGRRAGQQRGEADPSSDETRVIDRADPEHEIEPVIEQGSRRIRCSQLDAYGRIAGQEFFHLAN